MSIEISTLSTRELFSVFVGVLDELRTREIIRSTNNPLADLAEVLCERALSLKRAPKSTKGYDATDDSHLRYEVKARRLTAHNSSRQLSALRALDEQHFTFLAGVLFREDFSVFRGCLVPYALVLKHATYREHTNAWIFQLQDIVWEWPGVIDITKKLQEAERVL
jgi:hypothetical protein